MITGNKYSTFQIAKKSQLTIIINQAKISQALAVFTPTRNMNTIKTTENEFIELAKPYTITMKKKKNILN